MPFELVTSLAWQIVRALIERRAGPETPESRELLKQIDAHRSEIGRLEDDIGELEQRRVELRRQARSARPTWWH
ncbi:MAG TPA: hypothetical protein VNU19_18415, partial [Candidatus Acidoferrum sp.]|nr:hypothetical protein [Candidatus Acidoferrum sp.]